MLLGPIWQALSANLVVVTLVIAGWTLFQSRLEGRPLVLRRPIFATWMAASCAQLEEHPVGRREAGLAAPDRDDV